MEEQKFSVCNLALDTTIIKLMALGNYEKAETLLKDIQMKEEDYSEKNIALNLDDIYEYCILKEPDDPDRPHFEKTIKAIMEELPHIDKYKKLYNWDI